MARLDRALVAVSNTIGKLADNSQQREQERWMAMRQENFARLQHMLSEESRDKDRAMRKEELTTEITARRDLFGEEVKARKEMFGEETAARRTENQAERAWRSKENAADRAVQMSQITNRDTKDYEKDYLGRLQQIDKRIQELNDYKTQGNAEGKFVDATALAPIDSELAQLTEQRRGLAQERDVVLARTGDPRYRKLSAEEVAKMRKENPGQLPTQPQGAESAPMRDREEEMAVAAQAPRGGGTSIKVPQAPPKPEGMVAREERRGRPTDRGAIAGTGTGGQGFRDVVSAGRNILSGLDARKNESSVVKAAKQALQGGKPPAAEVVEALAKIDRRRLTGVFGINEQDLAALGL